MKHTRLPKYKTAWRILAVERDQAQRVKRRTLYRIKTDWRTLNDFLDTLIAKGYDILATRRMVVRDA